MVLTNTLLLITLTFLVLLEVTFESIYGDKHDLNSSLRLTATILFASALGLLIGNYLGAVTYLFLRLSIFDLSYSKINKKTWFYLGSNVTDLILKTLPRSFNVAMRILALLTALLINYIII
jgi:hypothetical protein